MSRSRPSGTRARSPERQDVVVLGAGLAGLAFAVLAVRAGLRVRVLARAGGRPAGIGEVVSRRGVAEAAACGLSEYVLGPARGPLVRTVVSWPPRAGTARCRPGDGGVVVEIGAVVRALARAPELAGRVRGVRGGRAVRAAGGWSVRLPDGDEVHARFAVDATGTGTVARAQGARRRRASSHVAFHGAFVAARALPEIERCLLVGASPQGWHYLVGLGPSDVAGALTTSTALARELDPVRAAFRLCSLLPDGALRPTAVRAAACGLSFVDTPSGRGWCAVGDAAFANDPLSGEGAAWAFASARRGLEVVLRGAEAARTYEAALRAAAQEALTERERAYGAGAREFGTAFWRGG